ncbi:MAG: hypothetical protein NUV61_02035 [Candidatus Azambacteria bacterium]|nr:hypothetical protein [Candidatus Azambacteria bacterium]
MATEESKAELSKGARIARSATTITMVALVALMAWYQFGGAEHSILASLKGNVVSLMNSAREVVTSQGEGEKLSTTNEGSFSVEAASTPWEVSTAQEGESVWGVYKEMLADKDVDFRNQTVNGLKNITILQNNIPMERLATNSLALGQEYSVLSTDAATKYASKVKEANEKLQGGASLSDLSPDLQTAYQLANAPSYDFLYSLSVDNIHSVYE